MGGIGKTELALQYALNDRDKKASARTYQAGICWIDVSNKVNVGIQILNFAKNYLNVPVLEEEGLQDRVKICWQNWIEGNTLIIFDDVKELNQIQDYLPPESRRFKVIITTRNISLRNNFKLLELKILDSKSAIKLLASFIGNQRIEKEIDKAEELCKWLGYLPLGIELVGRYLEQTEEKINHVYENLKHQKLKNESVKIPKDQIITAHRGLLAAFQLSWEQLSEETQQLECFLGLFEVRPIPWEIIESNIDKTIAKSTSQPKQIFNQSHQKLRELAKLSLIKKTGEQVYEIHTLIRQYLRQKLEESERGTTTKKIYCQLMVAIAKEIPAIPVQNDIQKFILTIPHLAVAAIELNQWIGNDDLFWVYEGLSRYYEGQGFYQEAEPWREQCLSITQERLGDEHPSVARSLNNLAALYESQGKYEAAEPLYKKALEIYKKLLGEEHPNTLGVKENLLFLQQQRTDDSI